MRMYEYAPAVSVGGCTSTVIISVGGCSVRCDHDVHQRDVDRHVLASAFVRSLAVDACEPLPKRQRCALIREELFKDFPNWVLDYDDVDARRTS